MAQVVKKKKKLGGRGTTGSTTSGKKVTPLRPFRNPQTPPCQPGCPIGNDARGALVTEVDAGSAADRAGMSRGDVIVEVNRKEVASVADLRDALKAAKQGETLLFLVKRGRGSLFIAVKPGKESD